jgi:hypothetical protein
MNATDQQNRKFTICFEGEEPCLVGTTFRHDQIQRREVIATNLQEIAVGKGLWALALLVIRSRATILNHQGNTSRPASVYQLTGQRGEPVSSLFDALEKSLNWHVKVFGSKTLFKKCVKTNRQGKALIVYLDSKYLSPSELQICWKGLDISDDEKQLYDLAGAIEKKWKTSKKVLPGLLKQDGCYHGHGRFVELRALDDGGRVEKLTRQCYYGEFKNAALTIRGTEADLIIDNVTMYNDPNCSEESERSSYRFEGHGTVVDGSVNILYKADDQTRRRWWAGVCVLHFPRTGLIHGHWMSAGHAEWGRTVLGTIELELEPT